MTATGTPEHDLDRRARLAGALYRWDPLGLRAEVDAPVADRYAALIDAIESGADGEFDRSALVMVLLDLIEQSGAAVSRSELSRSDEVTAFEVQAASFDAAIVAAERATDRYAEDLDMHRLDFAQAFSIHDDELPFRDGSEVYSLVRRDDLPPEEYLNRMFDTGTESQGTTSGVVPRSPDTVGR